MRTYSLKIIMSSDEDIWEKILSNLQNIINQNGSLHEFSLIPTSNSDIDKNKSPIHHENNYLGLEMWCAHNIFKYAQCSIIKGRKNIAPNNIYLTGALLIQPELTTFWNLKRELILKDQINLIHELQFSKLVLSFYNKSNESFAYRRWVLTTFILGKSNIANKYIYYKTLLTNEYFVLDLATKNSPNNYHAWNHRIWCFQNIVMPYLLDNNKIIIDELNFSNKWISSHVSEHTGFHYRQFILNCFKNQLKVPNSFITEVDTIDYTFIQEILLEKAPKHKFYYEYISLLLIELFIVLPSLHNHFPGHEAIWYHRRFIIYHLYQTCYDIFGIKSPLALKINDKNISYNVNIVQCLENPQSVGDMSAQASEFKSSILHKSICDNEKKFFTNLLVRNEWKLNDMDLMKTYKNWLVNMVGDCFQ